jgi:hypothetical protein
MSRRRFLERGLLAVLGTSLIGETACGPPVVRRRGAERTRDEDDRERGRQGVGRGFGLRRLLRRLF